MSYWDIAQMNLDPDLRARITACAAQERIESPEVWAIERMLRIVSAPEWDAAWESAIAADLPGPGRDPAVISDDMILASVQAVLDDAEPAPHAADQAAGQVVDADPVGAP